MITKPGDKDHFFPERGEKPKQAQKICDSCPVKKECNDYAEATGTRYGYWGGKMRKK